jgi:hypothetical protein
MSATRLVTFRLPEEQAVTLETVARFDGVALAEELREGVELLIAARRDDPEFLERVRESLEKVRGILDGVDGGDAVLEALTPRTSLRPEVEGRESRQDQDRTLTVPRFGVAPASEGLAVELGE